MGEELKEMLSKRPDELEGETLKLFKAIMKIADERDELKEIEESHRKENGELRERVKELEEENMQLEAIKDEAIRRYNLESIPISLVEETIEELKPIINKYEKQIENDEETDLSYEEIRNYACRIQVLQELLEKR